MYVNIYSNITIYEHKCSYNKILLHFPKKKIFLPDRDNYLLHSLKGTLSSFGA